jgi:hypothetical protein
MKSFTKPKGFACNFRQALACRRDEAALADGQPIRAGRKARAILFIQLFIELFNLLVVTTE